MSADPAPRCTFRASAAPPTALTPNGILRVGPLTDSQQAVWLSRYWDMQRGASQVLTKAWLLLPPRPLALLLEALRHLVTKHEVLRTTFALGPDGLPQQTVHDPGAFPLPVSYAEDDDEPGALSDQPWPDTGPLWHAVLLTRGEDVTAVRFHYDHLVSDGPGLAECCRQLMAHLHGVVDTARPTQPLDRLRRGPIPRNPADDAEHPVVHARQMLVPITEEIDAEHIDLHTATRIPAISPVLEDVSRRAPVSRAMLCKFFTVWFLCEYADQPDVLLANVLSLREPGDRGIDCRMLNVYEHVRIDASASLSANLEEIRDRTLALYERLERSGAASSDSGLPILARRGIGGASPVYFNYLTELEPAGYGRTTAPRGERLIHSTRSDVIPRMQDCCAPVVFFRVDRRDVLIDVLADSRVIPANVAAALGDVLRSLLLAAQERPDEPLSSFNPLFPAELRAALLPPRVADAWLDLDVLGAVLREAPGVRAAAADCVGSGVVARLQLAPGASVFNVHEFLLERLPSRRDIRAPDRYELGVTNGSWTPRSPTGPPLAPASDAERVLCSAIAAVHRGAAVNTAGTYADANGRAILAPAVVEELRARGWAGLRREHFDAPVTIRSIARHLVPT
jgi:hypothetical protein